MLLGFIRGYHGCLSSEEGWALWFPVSLALWLPGIGLGDSKAAQHPQKSAKVGLEVAGLLAEAQSCSWLLHPALPDAHVPSKGVLPTHKEPQASDVGDGLGQTKKGL